MIQMRVTRCVAVIKNKRCARCRVIMARSARVEGKVRISICRGNEFPQVIIQPSKRREIF